MYEYGEDYFDLDENFEFNTMINKVIDHEVEKRLAEKIKNYQEALERDNNSQKVIRDLKREVVELKKVLHDAEKKFKKVGADETLRRLLGGFKLGDEVWFLKSVYERKKCQTCLGDGELIVDFKGEKMKVKCPNCSSLGTISHTKKVVEEGVVSEIKIHTWADGRKCEVEMYLKPTSYKTSDILRVRNGEFFKTKEECEEALKELNK